MRRTIFFLHFRLPVLEIGFVRAADGARSATLLVDDVAALLLLAVALGLLHLVHLLFIAIAVKNLDVETWEIRSQILFELWEKLSVRTICARVVVDDELIVCGIAGSFFLGWSAFDLIWWMCWIRLVTRRVGLRC